ncbi:unnamed protein product [Protopolystoma xenopodis]|uniref:Uncharacterized protein n=1 Tax=Protopolystoma xenopodis TaxID=117903 RepID=A0A3S4ZXL8_9PLAT|nr:unnamed protein product [Protopolystoma xenopodis]
MTLNLEPGSCWPTASRTPTSELNSLFEQKTNKEPQRIYKVVFIGDSSVGKSSIIQATTGGGFSESIKSTIGLDFRVKTLNCDGVNIVLQLWDTAGQERYSNKHNFITIASLNDRQSNTCTNIAWGLCHL